MNSLKLRYLIFNQLEFNDLMKYCIVFPNELTICDSNAYFIDRLISKGVSVKYHRTLSGHAIDRYIRTLCHEKRVDSDPEVIFHTKDMFLEYEYLFGQIGMINKAIKKHQLNFVIECIRSNMKIDITPEEIYPIAHLLPEDVKNIFPFVIDIFFLETGIHNLNEEDKKNYLSGLYDTTYNNISDMESYIMGYSRRKDTKGIWDTAKEFLLKDEYQEKLERLLLMDRHYEYLPLTKAFYTWSFTHDLINGNHYKYLDTHFNDKNYNLVAFKRESSLDECYIMSLEMWEVLVKYFDEDDLQIPLINGLMKNCDPHLLKYLTYKSYELSDYINEFIY